MKASKKWLAFRTLLVAYTETTIYLMSMQDGKVVHQLAANENQFECAILNRDESLLIVFHKPNLVVTKVFQLRKGEKEPRYLVTLPQLFVSQMSKFGVVDSSADSQKLIFASQGKLALLKTPETPIPSPNLIIAPVRNLSWTSDGKWIVTGEDKSLCFWDGKTGRAQNLFRDDEEGRRESYALSPDNKYLAYTWRRKENEEDDVEVVMRKVEFNSDNHVVLGPKQLIFSMPQKKKVDVYGISFGPNASFIYIFESVKNITTLLLDDNMKVKSQHKLQLSRIQEIQKAENTDVKLWDLNLTTCLSFAAPDGTGSVAYLSSKAFSGVKPISYHTLVPGRGSMICSQAFGNEVLLWEEDIYNGTIKRSMCMKVSEDPKYRKFACSADGKFLLYYSGVRATVFAMDTGKPTGDWFEWPWFFSNCAFSPIDPSILAMSDFTFMVQVLSFQHKA